jgi:hypothetical protein
MQDPGLLQHQFPNVPIPTCFSLASNLLLQALQSLASSKIVLHWTQSWDFVYIQFPILEASQHIFVLRGLVVSLTPNPQLGGTRYPFLSGSSPFDLHCMGGPTNSYATASTAVRIIWPHKPHHYVKVSIISVEGKGSNIHFFQIIFSTVQPSLSWLSNGRFSLWHILKHLIHSSFFWHYFHMS